MGLHLLRTEILRSRISKGSLGRFHGVRRLGGGAIDGAERTLGSGSHRAGENIRTINDFACSGSRLLKGRPGQWEAREALHPPARLRTQRSSSGSMLSFIVLALWHSVPEGEHPNSFPLSPLLSFVIIRICPPIRQESKRLHPASLLASPGCPWSVDRMRGKSAHRSWRRLERCAQWPVLSTSRSRQCRVCGASSEQFQSPDAHRGQSRYAQPNSLSVDRHHHHTDVAGDHDLFADAARKYQHNSFLPCRFISCSERSPKSFAVFLGQSP